MSEAIIDEAVWVDWLFLKAAPFQTGRAGKKRVTQMINLFRAGKEGFQARSRERDADADNESVRSVAAAIDLVLEQAEAERTGLKNRIDNVLSIAAVVGGNDIDDYLTRTEDRSQMLRESDAEIRRGQERLGVIDQNISHFRFLRTELQSRFPDCKI
jgi:hypothetical protein